VYAAEIDGREFTFRASGSLWRDALVMQDLQTESLWSQVSGECIKGEMEGAKLEPIPSQHMTFTEFSSLYPQGRVLAKPGKGEPGSAYSDYFGSPDKLGVFGRADDFKQLPGKALIWGLRLESGPIAIAQQYLDSSRWVLIDDSRPPVAVVTDSARHTVVAFDLSTLDSSAIEQLRLNDERLIIDDNSRSWQAISGRAMHGGEGLKPLPLMSAYWFAWISFFPQTRLIK
jgi:hypothetical protein